MTKTAAMKTLIKTRELSTGMLAPLGISMESFLRLAQLPEAQAKSIIEKLAQKYEAEISSK